MSRASPSADDTRSTMLLRALARLTSRSGSTEIDPAMIGMKASPVPRLRSASQTMNCPRLVSVFMTCMRYVLQATMPSPITAGHRAPMRS